MSSFRFGDPYWENQKVFYLPHSCDEWVIGDIDSMKQFIKHAQEILEKVENGTYTEA